MSVPAHGRAEMRTESMSTAGQGGFETVGHVTATVSGQPAACLVMFISHGRAQDSRRGFSQAMVGFSDTDNVCPISHRWPLLGNAEPQVSAAQAGD